MDIIFFEINSKSKKYYIYDDGTYDIFKLAADGQKRTISNYLEYATLNYTMNETIVDDIEMNKIHKYEEDIKKGLSDISAGRYRIIG